VANAFQFGAFQASAFQTESAGIPGKTFSVKTFSSITFSTREDTAVAPPPGLPYGTGGGAAPSRKRLQEILDEFRAEKRAEREKQLAEKIAKRPRVLETAPRAVIGPVHTSEDDDEEALAWILESTL
jgi:hypothetical protein